MTRGKTLGNQGSVDPKNDDVDDSEANYDVGYCKPPEHTRFQPGRSGNPRGRPKGSRNLATALEQELRARVTIIENGRRRTITKLQAAVKQLVNQAASGNTRSMQFLLSLTQSSMLNEKAASPLSSEIDEQVKRDLLARVTQLVKDSADEDT